MIIQEIRVRATATNAFRVVLMKKNVWAKVRTYKRVEEWGVATEGANRVVGTSSLERDRPNGVYAGKPAQIFPGRNQVVLYVYCATYSRKFQTENLPRVRFRGEEETAR